MQCSRKFFEQCSTPIQIQNLTKMSNNEGADKMLCYAASDLGLQFLLIASFIWLKDKKQSFLIFHYCNI